MCSIIASFNKEKFIELIDLNQFRGNFSYSYTELEENNEVSHREKDFGPFATETISDENYKCGHLQSPTGGMLKEADRIHPVVLRGSMLWHNGLIQPRGMKTLKKILGTEEEFDTKLLALAIDKYGFDVLSDIDGLLSCLYRRNDKLFIFRTKHGKLHIDKDMNISSEKFDGGLNIPFDTIIEVDLNNKTYKEVGTFKTKRFNYLVKEGAGVRDLIL